MGNLIRNGSTSAGEAIQLPSSDATDRADDMGQTSSREIREVSHLGILPERQDRTDYAGILRDVGHRLMRLADSFEGDDSFRGYLASKPMPSGQMGPSDQVLAQLAQAFYVSRRRRQKHLAKDLFGEPSWDMLLDLYVNYVGNHPLRTTSVCVASDVPLSTGLRWIAVLENQGLLERRGVERDKRAVLVRLTDEGAQAVRDCLTEFWSQLQSVNDCYNR